MSEFTEPDKKVVSAIEAMDDTTAVRILTDLSGPRWRNAAAECQWSPDLARALCNEIGVTPAADKSSPGDVARTAVQLFAHDPDLRAPITAMIRNPAPSRFALDPVSGTMLATFALLAIQSHIEISRDKHGQWEFRFKKTPSKDSLVAPLLKKLISLISGGPPSTT